MIWGIRKLDEWASQKLGRIRTVSTLGLSRSLRDGILSQSFLQATQDKKTYAVFPFEMVCFCFNFTQAYFVLGRLHSI